MCFKNYDTPGKQIFTEVIIYCFQISSSMRVALNSFIHNFRSMFCNALNAGLALML